MWESIQEIHGKYFIFWIEINILYIYVPFLYSFNQVFAIKQYKNLKKYISVEEKYHNKNS